jgi:chromosome transmission fidelity protein 4
MNDIVTKYGHGPGPSGIVFAPGGDRVVTCGADSYAKVRPTKGKDTPLKSLEEKAEINTIALTSDGKSLIVGTDDCFVKEYSFPECVFKRNIMRLTLPVKHVACGGANGKIVAVASDGPVVHLVDFTGNPIEFTCKGHTENVKSVAFDPKHKFLASSSCDGTVRVWDLLSKQQLTEIPCMPKDDGSSDQLSRIAWHPSGEFLAMPQGNSVLVIKRDSWETAYKLSAHKNLLSLVAWSADGLHLASAAMDNKLLLWDTTTQEPIKVYKHDKPFSALVFAPETNKLALTDTEGRYQVIEDIVPTTTASAAVPTANASAEVAKEAETEAPAAKESAPAAAEKVASAEGAAGAAVDKGTKRTADAAAEGSAAKEPAAPSGAGGEGKKEGKKRVKKSKKRRLSRLKRNKIDSDSDDSDDEEEEVDAASPAKGSPLKGDDEPGVEADVDMEGADGMSESVSEVKKHLGFDEGASPIGASPPSGQPLGSMDVVAPPVEVVASTEHLDLMQGPFQPGSTHAGSDGKRRYLVWNATGTIISRDEETHSQLEIEFSDSSRHRSVRLTDHYQFTMAALNDTAAFFASEAGELPEDAPEDAKPSASTLFYRPFQSWASNSEWVLQLSEGESAVAVAVGRKFAAVATTRQFLRLFKSSGIQAGVVQLPGPVVTMVGSDCGNGLLAVIYHTAPTYDGRQKLGYMLLSTEQGTELGRGSIDLLPDAVLTWAGFSEENVLVVIDSSGLLLGLSPTLGMQWSPLLDLHRISTSEFETHWPVCVQGGKLLCVHLQGGLAGISNWDVPKTIPRPILKAIRLQMPLLQLERGAKGERGQAAALEDAYLRGDMHRQLHNWERKMRLRDSTRDEEEARRVVLENAELDKTTIKLVQAAMKDGRSARALELCGRLTLAKSFDIVLRIAQHARGQNDLGERINALKALKLQEEEEEEDDDESEEDEDDEEEDEAMRRQQMQQMRQRQQQQQQQQQQQAVDDSNEISGDEEMAEAGEEVEEAQMGDDDADADEDADDDAGAPSPPPKVQRNAGSENPFSKSKVEPKAKENKGSNKGSSKGGSKGTGKGNPFAKKQLTASAQKSKKSLHNGDLNECARALQEEKKKSTEVRDCA